MIWIKYSTVFLEISKASDAINFNILLLVLKYIIYEDSAINLIDNFLRNRPQVIKFEQLLSNHLPIICRVPQETIVGVLKIYISFYLKKIV